MEEHWIYEKYQTLMKKQRVKEFLLENFYTNNFNVIEKTIHQENELQKISGLATVLYAILMKTEWIPTQFKCFLAVIMSSQEGKEKGQDTTTMISNEFFLDILLSHGALKKDHTTNDTVCSSMENEFACLMTNKTNETHQTNKS